MAMGGEKDMRVPFFLLYELEKCFGQMYMFLNAKLNILCE